MVLIISNYHHVEINGVKYRLAESAEGGHYIEGGEPLRPPNAQVVQGASQTQFQMRPDTLVWLIDSWAGGAGQIKFNPETPDRMRVLRNVDGFTTPGALRKGFYPLDADAPNANDVFVRSTGFVAPDGTPWVASWASGASPFAYRALFWDAGVWTAQDSDSAQSVSTGPGTIAYNPHAATLNNAAILFLQEGKIVQFDGNTTWTAWATHANITDVGQNSRMAVLGDYLYFTQDPFEVVSTPTKLYEYLATSAPGAVAPTKVFEHTKIVAMTVSQNRGYLLCSEAGGAAVYELIPTTSAGSAVVLRLGFIEGVVGEQLSYAAGLLLLTTDTGRVYYLRPGAEYGILVSNQTLLDAPEQVFTGDTVSTETFLYTTVVHDFSTAANQTYLLMIDKVTGAWQEVGQLSSASHEVMAALRAQTDTQKPYEQVWTGDIVGTEDGRSFTSEFADVSLAGYFLSPWWNFGLAEKKQLLSIRVQHDMDPDWTFSLYARKDGDDDSETLIGTITGTGSPTVTTLVPSSALEFSQLSVRGVFGGVGDHDQIPYVYSVEVRATVVQPQKLWRLTLDCADDATGVTPSHSGTTKMANVRTVGDGGAPVTFKNGYLTPEIGSIDYTVVVDSYQINADRPGEGTAQVVLREVS